MKICPYCLTETKSLVCGKCNHDTVTKFNQNMYNLVAYIIATIVLSGFIIIAEHIINGKG